MEEGTRNKKTIFVGGLTSDIDQTLLIETFSTFGDVIDVQIPPAQNKDKSQDTTGRHRGFAFVTFATQLDAQDAIDNMDNNELRGSILRVNLAKPQRGGTEQSQYGRAIWESEDWLKKNAKPVGQGGEATDADVIEGGEDDAPEAMEE